MRRYLICLLLLATGALAQEIRRPTAEYGLGGCFTGCTVYDGDIYFPNAYDGSGLSTSSSNAITGVIGGTDTHEMNRGFTTWAAESGTYSSYTLNVNSACSVPKIPAQCVIDYSTNAGSTWTTLKIGSWTQQTNTSASISGAIALSQIRVRVSIVASDGPTTGTTGQASLTLYDIWTSGTLASSGKRIPYVIVN